MVVAQSINNNSIHTLITELTDRLRAGEHFDNQLLTATAHRIFGGSRAQGAYTPRDAYDAIETAVNLLLLKVRAGHMMQADFDQSIPQLRALLAQLPRQTDRTIEQIEYQQFSSPPTLAYLAARLLNPQPGSIVLEPSAGTGSLAIWPQAIGARVICNEISPRRRSLLIDELGFETHDVDAELLDDLLPTHILPTDILMNPPFSATGGRVAQHRTIYGAKHLESALRRLQEGGRLVAIISRGMSLTSPGFSEWWQRIASVYNVRANWGINGKEYGKYGTTYGAQIVIIDKNGPTPGKTWKQRLQTIAWGKSDTLEHAWRELHKLAIRSAVVEPPDPAESEEESGLFVRYRAARIKGGHRHPANVVEAASMAGVKPPVITYRPRLSRQIVTEGRLSDLQLEAVIYAGQRHNQQLPNGARGGFFIGHGTGFGKGRPLAGIIADNRNQGRRKAVWFSVNNDLMEATRRDLTDIGLGDIPLARINDYQADDEILLPNGVLFCTYSSLISHSKKGSRRIDQIQRWLGPDGVVIYDEGHKAKNALADGIGEPTLTGQAVIELQDSNPDYRIVYSSATGATDVRHMAYMVRLGLWGPGTAFPGGFEEFLTEIEEGGVGAMEMVCRDLKAFGMYLSASLSYGTCPNSGKAVEYSERVHDLTPEQKEMYNHAAAAWQVVLQNMHQALKLTGAGTRTKAATIRRFWADHQRFCRQVIAAFKIPTVIAETQKALAAGESVVISLVGTGEARTRDLVTKAMAEGAMLEDLDHTPRQVLGELLYRGFPTALYQDQTDEATGKTIQVAVKDKDGKPRQSREALKMRQKLIDGLSALQLPEGPLDQLINFFGEENVAEITGRARRLIRNPKTGRVEYKKRSPEGVAMSRVNTYEMRQFQSGRKRIAIISNAGSVGISLHSSNREENKQRRLHMVLEFGWSADMQMQSFGRTHRSDEAVPPKYKLVPTGLAGEMRFASTIARRLGSLGALTKGDRDAADNSNLARYNFETEYGKAALSILLRRIMIGETVPGLDNPRQALRDIALLKPDSDGGEEVRPEDQRDVPRFLNRILALDVDRQNALFNYFAQTFDEIINFAKANGTFDEGVTDIKALAIRLASQTVVYADPITQAQTTHYRLQVDRAIKTIGFDYADNVRMNNKGSAFLKHRKNDHFILVVPSSRQTDSESGKTFKTFSVWRPEGARTGYLKEDDLARYIPVKPEDVQAWWSKRCKDIPNFETIEMHIIGGAILPLWQCLKGREGSSLRVVRVSTESKQRIVGVLIPPATVSSLLRTLGLSRRLESPLQIFNAVLHENEEVTLSGGMTIKQVWHQGEPAIEVCGASIYKFEHFREIGLINEEIKFRQRFFIPTDEHKGVAVLTTLLGAYPALQDQEDDDQPGSGAPVPVSANPDEVIYLPDWVLSPGESVH